MEPFSWIKFFAGFNLFKGATLGKFVYYVAIWALCALVVYGVYQKVFVKPTTVVTGTQIINNAEPKDWAGFGCNMWRLYIKTGIRGGK